MAIAFEEKMSDFTAQIRLFIEQKPERSEDCKPVLQLYPDDSGLLAVLDGAGGAGGTSYSLAGGGSFTGAFLASRLGRKTLTDFFDELKQQSLPVISNLAVKQLEERLKADFKAQTAKLQNGTESKIKSSLIRNLPTTMAAIYYEKARDVSRKMVLRRGAASADFSIRRTACRAKVRRAVGGRLALLFAHG